MLNVHSECVHIMTRCSTIIVKVKQHSCTKKTMVVVIVIAFERSLTVIYTHRGRAFRCVVYVKDAHIADIDTFCMTDVDCMTRMGYGVRGFMSVVGVFLSLGVY